MKRTKTELEIDRFPDEIKCFLKDAPVYDSSCSEESRVYFIDTNGGYFLK